MLSVSLLSATYRQRALTSVKEENSQMMRVAFGALLSSIQRYQIAHQFGNTEFELEKLSNELTKMQSSFEKVESEEEKNTLFLSTLIGVGAVSTFGISFANQLDVESLIKETMILGYYALRVNTILNRLPESINLIYQGLLDAKLLVKFLDEEQKIYEPTHPISFSLSASPSVEFKNVTFAYDSSRTNLHGVSFAIKPGQKVAIMGPSGSGKSTLFYLLQRFYDYKGKILVNGIDIKKILTKDLRACMSVLSQETGLIGNTLYDHIQYGNLKCNKEDVFKAAEKVGLNFDKDRFFKPIQQYGTDFSGGEKQRINIARSMLKEKVGIFLLDEPTSALDQKTAHNIFHDLNKITKGATTLVITHDPNIAVKSDLILYMDEGRVLEMGTFDNLMEKKGKLYEQILIQCEKLNITLDKLHSIDNQNNQMQQNNQLRF